ncbi:sigma 1 type opioid receptor [Trichuris trichiura]|uniref:Sigma non-opioid intracellular receptor 1 n=1 Tax=Trichuris trichiura TaxID=36087 RepID=A0A077ZEX4_TRITR|nr:sigma 1 type opioid receptor [Trichuris trichiura]
MGEKYAGQPLTESVNGIHRDLKLVYGDHIMDLWSKGLISHFRNQKFRPSETAFWLPFCGGGFVGRIHFVHISLSEYVAIIGSPVKTVGNTARLWMNHSCTVLSGSLERSDGFQKDNFQPGKHARFAQLDSSIVELNEETWLFCYGRGFTPMAMPYMTFCMLGQADIIPTIDLVTVAAKSVLTEWFVWAKESIAWMMDSVRKK